MTFEIIEHDASTLNLVLKHGKERVEILIYKNGEITDVACGWEKIDDTAMCNAFNALKILQRLTSGPQAQNSKP